MNDKDRKAIDLCIKTWKTESNGIYNYKSGSSEILQVNDTISKNVYVIRKRNNRIIKAYQNSEYNDEDEILFLIRKSFKTQKFEIVNPVRKLLKKNDYNINALNRRMWYIVKPKDYYNENINEEYDLNENDIIKLGRRKFEIIKKNINAKEKRFDINQDNDIYSISEMNQKKGSIFNIDLEPDYYQITEKEIEKKISQENEKNLLKTNDLTPENSEINNKVSNINTQDNIDDDFNNNNGNEELCRICFDYKSTKNNPKLRLCQCKDYIHYECLKAYLSTKLEIHENEKGNVRTYNCNKFNCDVCLAPYPLRFRIAEFNKLYELIDINMPKELDYVILESLDYIKDNGNIKTVHLVELNDEEINIGRYDTNDIIDTDISVSRKHAVMKYNKETGSLFLENLSEKFGTLVLIKGNIKMNDKKIHFQVGKSYIVANLVDDLDENKKNQFRNNDTENSDSI